MNTLKKTHRSYLFVPANRLERFEKALNTDADAVIIDLEDAVPAELKNAARDSLKQWLIEHSDKHIMIRINSKQTQWFEADIQLALLPNVDAIVLPKTESVSDLAAVTAIHSLDLFALIETPLGFAQVRQIAGAPHVRALMFGSIDFQLEMGMQAGYHELLSFRNEIVLASKLAGIAPPVDGVTVDFKNEDVVQLETQQAKSLGFAGKLCIHPNQVSVVNQTFSPSPEEIEWATRVLNAIEISQNQAVSLDGKMIDLPVISRAQKILLQADQNTALH